MATSAEIIDSLNTDLAMEHGAIFQYVVHSMQLRDSRLADAVKKMAREEMWHFEWLTEAIRDRGGTPTLERAELALSEALGESMALDVDTEDGALDHYEHTLELVGDSDPELRALIARIMDDERHHRFQFYRLALDIERDGEGRHAAQPAIDPSDLPVVGGAMVVEYEGILQYLVNKYFCGDCDAAEVYFELAIDEMRHAGWAGEYVAGFGMPRVAEPPLDSVTPVRSVVEAHVQAEGHELRAREFYGRQVHAAADPDLKMDVERAEHQHGYHRAVLGEMK